MKGSERSFRGRPFPSPPDWQRPQPPPAHALSRQDACGSLMNMGHSLPPRVSTFCSSSDGTGTASDSGSQPYRYHWSRGPQRGRGRYDDDRRHWIHSETLPPPSSDRFVVVSYNILGVDNANQHWRELYWHIPSFIMDWNHRKGRILLELGLWSPDIICLQEVDRFEDLQNDLVQRGYEGVYKGRSGGSSDGCALFWRTQKFRLLQEESIEYQELDLRHNVAQLCILQTTETRHTGQNRGKSKRSKERVADNCIVVCNIHVLFNPNRGDIKLGQVRHLLEKAYSLSQEWGGIPVVVAGDFNSIPQSPLYQFLRDSTLDVSCFDRRAISGQVEVPREVRGTRAERWTSSTQLQMNIEGQEVHAESSIISANWRDINEDRSLRAYQWTAEELETATGSATESLMTHRFKLQSSYSSIQGPAETRDTSNEPLVTTYHGKFMGTVDYIWYSEGLEAVKVLDILPVHVLQRTKGLPSKKWGSDHLALACEFAFLTSGAQTSGDSAREKTSYF